MYWLPLFSSFMHTIQKLLLISSILSFTSSKFFHPFITFTGSRYLTVAMLDAGITAFINEGNKKEKKIFQSKKKNEKLNFLPPLISFQFETYFNDEIINSTILKIFVYQDSNIMMLETEVSMKWLSTVYCVCYSIILFDHQCLRLPALSLYLSLHINWNVSISHLNNQRAVSLFR